MVLWSWTNFCYTCFVLKSSMLQKALEPSYGNRNRSLSYRR